MIIKKVEKYNSQMVITVWQTC